MNAVLENDTFSWSISIGLNANHIIQISKFSMGFLIRLRRPVYRKRKQILSLFHKIQVDACPSAKHGYCQIQDQIATSKKPNNMYKSLKTSLIPLSSVVVHMRALNLSLDWMVFQEKQIPTRACLHQPVKFSYYYRRPIKGEMSSLEPLVQMPCKEGMHHTNQDASHKDLHGMHLLLLASQNHPLPHYQIVPTNKKVEFGVGNNIENNISMI